MIGQRTETPALRSGGSPDAEVARLADERRVWTGISGETLPGREVGDHLLAAVEHLRRVGWRPEDGGGVYEALLAASPGGPADMDTRVAAGTLLDLLLRVRLDVPRADYAAWEARAHRTLPEVLDLLRAAAEIARRYGPQGGAR